ncbi:MAG: glycosyltransferase family 4 protein [Sphingobacteriaceae bacterium]|nr:glycosyltransferase family 4 protein [Sphingobacteriaceae bacterium]
MAKGFIANGVDLKLLCINTAKHFKPDDQVPSDFKSNCKYQSVFKNTNTSFFGALSNLFSTDSYFVSRFYFPEFDKQLKKDLTSNQYEIVQLEGLFMAVYLPVIRKYSKAKVILRAHNVEYLIWDRHIRNEKNILKKFYLSIQNKRLKKFEISTCNQVDGIVSITDVDKNIFSQLAPKSKGFTCITGVDLKEYQMKENEVNTKMFIFSSMDWMPNIEAVDWFLKNCFPKITKAVPDCRLVIAGRNMPSHIRQLKDKNIEIMEDVKSSSSFYQNHQLMLVPLLSGSGLRIKIIEGMAYGKAIVSTSVGAEGIKAVNGKHFVLEDETNKFSDAVIYLLQNKEELNKLSLNARKFAEENFENKKVVQGLLNFYPELNA